MVAASASVDRARAVLREKPIGIGTDFFQQLELHVEHGVVGRRRRVVAGARVVARAGCSTRMVVRTGAAACRIEFRAVSTSYPNSANSPSFPHVHSSKLVTPSSNKQSEKSFGAARPGPWQGVPTNPCPLPKCRWVPCRRPHQTLSRGRCSESCFNGGVTARPESRPAGREGGACRTGQRPAAGRTLIGRAGFLSSPYSPQAVQTPKVRHCTQCGYLFH